MVCEQANFYYFLDAFPSDRVCFIKDAWAKKLDIFMLCDKPSSYHGETNYARNFECLRCPSMHRGASKFPLSKIARCSVEALLCLSLEVIKAKDILCYSKRVFTP